MLDQSGVTPFSSRRRPQGGGLDYPSRFLNLMAFDRPSPTDTAAIQKWAASFYRSSGLFRDIVDKLSRYPVTSIAATGDTAAKWSDILNHQLKIREKLVSIGINKNTFGNAFISIIPLFNRYLKCGQKGCESFKGNPIERVSYKYQNWQFVGKCNACGKSGVMTIKDEYIKGEGVKISDGINLKIWPTQSIHVKANKITGKHRIIYKLDPTEVKAIKKGDKFIIETMPSDFLEAVKLHGDKAAVELDQDRTFWYAEEDLAEPNASAMSLPFFFSAWKTMWQIFIHRKAQECIVSDHLLPYRVVYPASSGTVDPISAIDLGQWRSSVKSLLQRWQNDPAEIAQMPMELGFQQLGGQGKAMSLNDEIRSVNQELLVELGIPPDLIYGNMNWSGSSVSLRMLENRFLYTVNQHDVFLKAVCDFISEHFSIKVPDSVNLSPFKMADDVAKLNVYLSLAAQGKISYQRALGVLGDEINFEEEAKVIAKEKAASAMALSAMQEATAIAAAKASRITNREQVISQIEAQDLQNALTPTLQGSVSAGQSILTPQGLTAKINAMPENQRQQELQGLQATNPEVYQQVISSMGMGQPQQPSTNAPLPEQKPPRREGVKQRI